MVHISINTTQQNSLQPRAEHWKVLLSSFHLNSHVLGFHPRTRQHSLLQLNIKPQQSSAQQLSFEQSRFRISSTYQHSLIQLNIKPQQSSAQQLSFEQSRFTISSTYQHSLIQLNIKPQQSSTQQLSFEQSRSGFFNTDATLHSVIYLFISFQMNGQNKKIKIRTTRGHDQKNSLCIERE